MPRDISGNYTLPAGNPVVVGTIIDVNWANPTLNDIAAQLNNVLTLDGITRPLAPIAFLSGSASSRKHKLSSLNVLDHHFYNFNYSQTYQNCIA